MPVSIVDRKLKPKSDLGRRLLLLCEAKGHRNLAEAAKACGMNYHQVYDIVTGKRDPRISTLARITEALGGSLTELFSVGNLPAPENVSIDQIAVA